MTCERCTELRAELAAADQNLKTMLQAAGEEAERQLAAAREEIAKLREEMSKLPQSETVAARYPTNSMCASGHQMVLWMDDDFGPCPVCAIPANSKEESK